MDKRLIERAIESAKARKYKLEQDMSRDISDKHLEKAARQKEVAEVTVQALERMMPKKPLEIEEREEPDFYYLAFMCPTCNEAVIGQPYRPNNCKHCGQRIDWGE